MYGLSVWSCSSCIFTTQSFSRCVINPAYSSPPVVCVLASRPVPPWGGASVRCCSSWGCWEGIVARSGSPANSAGWKRCCCCCISCCRYNCCWWGKNGGQCILNTDMQNNSIFAVNYCLLLHYLATWLETLFSRMHIGLLYALNYYLANLLTYITPCQQLRPHLNFLKPNLAYLLLSGFTG